GRMPVVVTGKQDSPLQPGPFGHLLRLAERDGEGLFAKHVELAIERGARDLGVAIGRRCYIHEIESRCLRPDALVGGRLNGGARKRAMRRRSPRRRHVGNRSDHDVADAMGTLDVDWKMSVLGDESISDQRATSRHFHFPLLAANQSGTSMRYSVER